jgi:phosphatidylserine/phosphatidylglycerophosphate/cardiolipin synthase-like enzyme
VLTVFDRWTSTIIDLARDLLSHWRDSRLVWLPAQLALTPTQVDEQSEIDDIVGRVAGHPFAGNNELAYLRTADLPLEIARSILAARQYHVLWTHDFTGRRPSGRLDEVSYTLVADAYLPALTTAVQRYDRTGDLPQFFILLDAYYYHGRWGRMWMSVLENPLIAGVPLRDDEAPQADHLRRRLDALRDAVASSRRLQREAAANGGSEWLAKVVKVNVNVVLPSDFSFRSGRTLPPIPFVPDNVMRDHRKLVLYDYSETNPYDGGLLVTGVGIGEHYASATWEDRGYRVRGPAALEARAAVRRALASNGFRPEQIPGPLRASDGPSVDSSRATPSAGIARALQVDNEPGFGAKHAAAARAMLYTLAAPGSDIIVPDPLWLSESWTGMLLAAAARGCRVVIVAPATPNSPNPEGVVVALQHDVLHRMLTIRDRFAPRIRAASGAFHIGVYAAHAPVTDVRARFAEVRAGLARAPWIREMMPFDSAALASLDSATMQADRTDAGAILAKDEQPREPQLHQKTQLIAAPGAISSLVRRPGWAGLLARTLLAQSRETARFAEGLALASDTAVARSPDELLEGYERSLSASDRKRLSFYFTVGSENHDARGLLMDGEASVIVSGFDASVGVVDVFYLMARTNWVNDGVDIDRLVPAQRGLLARIARLIRFAI